jgi:hypothetical protein
MPQFMIQGRRPRIILPWHAVTTSQLYVRNWIYQRCFLVEFCCFADAYSISKQILHKGSNYPTSNTKGALFAGRVRFSKVSGSWSLPHPARPCTVMCAIGKAVASEPSEHDRERKVFGENHSLMFGPILQHIQYKQYIDLSIHLSSS